LAAVEAADALLPVCTMTWVALMVVELTVPSTKTCVPFLMALAAIELDPFLYFVEEASSTVTF
jgi:hypothetical protein